MQRTRWAPILPCNRPAVRWKVAAIHSGSCSTSAGALPVLRSQFQILQCNITYPGSSRLSNKHGVCSKAMSVANTLVVLPNLRVQHRLSRLITVVDKILHLQQVNAKGAERFFGKVAGQRTSACSAPGSYMLCSLMQDPGQGLSGTWPSSPYQVAGAIC